MRDYLRGGLFEGGQLNDIRYYLCKVGLALQQIRGSAHITYKTQKNLRQTLAKSCFVRCSCWCCCRNFSSISYLYRRQSLDRSRKYHQYFLLLLIFSCTNLIAITVDRFLAVLYPIKHRILSTPKRASIIIAILWFLCPNSIYSAVSFHSHWQQMLTSH